MRRRQGQLLDLEAQILAALVGNPAPDAEVHGFALAKDLADRQGSLRLTSHGTLYKALARLEDAGALRSRWEDSVVAEREGRPRRRLYRITGAGRAALQAHLAAGAPRVARPGRLGLQSP